MLPPARIEVKRGGIRNIAARIVRNDRDVIADLVLVRPAFSRIKRLAYNNVRSPGNSTIGAVRVE